ncbi:hypothetical protein GCM10018772_61580 [Streptomyces fumanus]|uniref:Uncharacterized protein n=1 Tax=Streptomyces fumanus TaxID=67302 RepID=A0A919AX17_9ACTN|nr:hypothetical protein GCM10018772_61580 [Streptomyces fumanus]
MGFDRILDEAHETADPVHLMRVFGIAPTTAMKYVKAPTLTASSIPCLCDGRALSEISGHLS